MQDSPHHAMSQKTGQTTTGDVESPDGVRGSHPFGTYASDFEPPPGASLLCPEVSKALSGVLLIAEQKKRNEECTKVTINMANLTKNLLNHAIRISKALINNDLLGNRGLEVRCNGVRQTFPMDIYGRSSRGYSRYHFASTNVV